MRDFLFYSAIGGFCLSLAVLKAGVLWKAVMTWLDMKLFPSRWADSIVPSERGGPLRFFAHCPACISFWISMLVSAFIYGPSRVHLGVPLVVGMLLDGFSSVGIIWFVHVVLTKLGQYEL